MVLFYYKARIITNNTAVCSKRYINYTFHKKGFY
jgi:hypothetical protein